MQPYRQQALVPYAVEVEMGKPRALCSAENLLILLLFLLVAQANDLTTEVINGLLSTMKFACMQRIYIYKLPSVL